ncbi:hypothetical protein MKW94_014615 [Papaver nudicaule]|uniref:Uncharacterized protein n=1 Tax=Papaver nudicaule TaxID=74823 RepID=A0AA41S609_PAPNU|nr:hypothetical protein [Papaver nudicaule]
MSVIPIKPLATAEPQITTMAMGNIEKTDREQLYVSLPRVGVMDDIIATDFPENLTINVRSLLCIVKDILKYVISPITKIFVNVRIYDNNNVMQILSYTEISRYSWDVKLVNVLAAFAMNYGDCLLTSQLETVNPMDLPIGLSVLNHDENISSTSTNTKTTSETELINAISKLLQSILSITETIVEFSELPAGYITSDDSSSLSRATSLIQPAVYWTIRCCVSQFNGLLKVSDQMMEPWEFSLPSWDHKTDRIHGNLRREINSCRQQIEHKKHKQVHENLVELFRTTQTNSMEILKALLCTKDALPLLDGSSKTRVGVEVLRGKTVMLLISDPEISQAELLILEQIYNDVHLGKSERPYEVIWLPVHDTTQSIGWTDTMQHEFDQVRSSMPWYSLYHPSFLDPAAIQFIKEQWQFDKKKPTIVVLDHHGKVTCQNAIHMISRLWNSEKWTMEFIVNGIDPTVLEWIRDDKFVCLYGGEDIDWVRKFATTMQHVVQESKINLEMLYVGKSNPKEQVKKNIDIIMKERLSHCWQDPMSIWFFWDRLESMWYSKLQHSHTINNDPMMREITTMLTLDGSNDGWAILTKGSGEMVKAHGSKMLEVLAEFNEWKTNVEQQGFVQAIVRALDSYSSPEHCSCLVLPRMTLGKTHELSCTECGRPMELYTLYRCCT